MKGITTYTLRQPRRRFPRSIIAVFAICLLDGDLAAAAPNSGGDVYHEKCARCHGEDGQGIAGECDQPLAGDSSVAELAELIEFTMPPDDPT